MPEVLTSVPALVNDATPSAGDGRVTVTLQFRSAAVSRVFCAALRDCQQRGEDVGLVVFARGVPVEGSRNANQ